MYSGWLIEEGERNRLLERFPPHYSDVIAHHITYQFGVPHSELVLPRSTRAHVVGVADDGVRLEALVVTVGGSVIRPDGLTYHSTWSIDKALGAKPFMSNQVIKLGYREVVPFAFRITPQLFETTPPVNL